MKYAPTMAGTEMFLCPLLYYKYYKYCKSQDCHPTACTGRQKDSKVLPTPSPQATPVKSEFTTWTVSDLSSVGVSEITHIQTKSPQLDLKKYGWTRDEIE